ncbi:MAG: undecaprenyldiphospho-muramoylpentapeptide beta-N-acetylglucosaminyltransferase [Deltaproteobacteria bacterium]|nr:undecaprenyldiphospho-muramoylpentapeptide beta-N-acetylglucosaminyltransferase [Deltaproteobacteria bacterium]
MRIVLTGGGTGGHLFPALALADELKAKNKGCEILFIASTAGIEKDIVPKYGYTLELLDIEGFKGKGWFSKLSVGLRAAKAVILASKILKPFQPNWVIGTGGYSSGPVILAARLLRIKTAILEQNTIPGLTNRMLGRIANKVFVAFEESKKFFPGGRVILAGNPVRREILGAGIDKEKETEKRRNGETETNIPRFSAPPNHPFTILIFGGSQGAKAVNTAFLDAMEYLVDIRDSIKIIHQTGDTGYTSVKETYERKGIKADVIRFIDDMAKAYSLADLVICRAGATSIAEITALGLASVLIPYPFATNNHQEMNAKYLAGRGAAIVMRQDEIIGDALANAIRKFYKNRDELQKVKQNAKALGRPNAAMEITNILLANYKLSEAKTKKQVAGQKALACLLPLASCILNYV